ncbi:MAG: hypothetical protein ACSW8C_01315 [bacterium]
MKNFQKSFNLLVICFYCVSAFATEIEEAYRKMKKDGSNRLVLNRVIIDDSVTSEIGKISDLEEIELIECRFLKRDNISGIIRNPKTVIFNNSDLNDCLDDLNWTILHFHLETIVYRKTTLNEKELESIGEFLKRNTTLKNFYLSCPMDVGVFERRLEQALNSKILDIFSVWSPSFDNTWLSKLREICEKVQRRKDKPITIQLGGGPIDQDIFVKLKERSEASGIKIELLNNDPWRRGSHASCVSSIETVPVPVPKEVTPILTLPTSMPPEEVIRLYVKEWSDKSFLTLGNVLAYRNIFDQTIVLTNGSFESVSVLKDTHGCLCIPADDLTSFVGQANPNLKETITSDSCFKNEYRMREDGLELSPLPGMTIYEVFYAIFKYHREVCCQEPTMKKKIFSGKTELPEPQQFIFLNCRHTEIQIGALIEVLNTVIRDINCEEDYVRKLVCLLPKLLIGQLKDVEKRVRTWGCFGKKFVEVFKQVEDQKTRGIINPDFCIYSFFESCDTCRKVSWLCESINKKAFCFAVLDSNATSIPGVRFFCESTSERVVFSNQSQLEEMSKEDILEKFLPRFLLGDSTASHRSTVNATHGESGDERWTDSEDEGGMGDGSGFSSGSNSKRGYRRLKRDEKDDRRHHHHSHHNHGRDRSRSKHSSRDSLESSWSFSSDEEAGSL